MRRLRRAVKWGGPYHCKDFFSKTIAIHVRWRTLGHESTPPYQTALDLIFSYVHPSKSQKSLGPFRSIRLTSDGMRADAGEALLAPYRNHQWSVDDLDYFRLDCTGRVMVHFERSGERSSRYGPFERFSAVNGLAYGDDHVIAFLDVKVNEWLYYDAGYHWPVMVVSDAKSVLS